MTIITAKKNIRLQKFLEEVQKDLLLQIMTGVKNGVISIDYSQNFAREFIELLPPVSVYDLVQKLKLLASRHRVAQSVYLKYVDVYYENRKQKMLKKASKHIKSGDVERALKALKQRRLI